MHIAYACNMSSKSSDKNIILYRAACKIVDKDDVADLSIYLPRVFLFNSSTFCIIPKIGDKIL